MAFEKLQSFIFKQLSATRLPGLSAAAVKDGEIIWARGFGFRDVASGLNATPHTLYGMASVTKSFTCIALMQLAEQGKLSVDDPVSKYIPAFTIEPEGEPVRLWHLMSHTSGIPALAYAEAVIDGATGARECWYPVATTDDLLAFMDDADSWTLTEPGQRWFYLNEGYALLGRVIEEVSGEPYDTYITNHILQPLGMTRSFFDKATFEADPDTATPYIITEKGEQIASTYAWGGLTADGALISNALDMARYVIMYLNNGAYDGGQLVSTQSLQEMQTPRILYPHVGNPFGDSSYGFGLVHTPNFLGHTLIGHSGSVGTATSQMSFIPDAGIGMVIITNGSGYATSQFAMYGLAEMLGEDPDELPFVRRDNLLDELTGHYEGYKGTIRFEVKREGDFLRVEENLKFGSTVTLLVPEDLGDSYRQFYTLRTGVKVPVEFRVSQDGIDLVFERYLLRRTGSLT